MDFGPKPIFSSKDAAKGRKIVDSSFVGKISYYMVTSVTLFCDVESKEKKLMGVTRVCKGRQLVKEFFFLDKALVDP